MPPRLLVATACLFIQVRDEQTRSLKDEDKEREEERNDHSLEGKKRWRRDEKKTRRERQEEERGERGV